MKRLVSLLLLLCVLLPVFFINAVGIKIEAAGAIKVACVGDSITEGYGRDNPNSYPGVLGRTLGSDYEVKNFGFGGRTLHSNSDYPYTKEDIYQESLDYQADIVVIMLGTNDAKTHNWVDEVKSTFKEELIAFVNTYRNLSNRPQVYLMTSPCVFGNGNFSIDPELIKEVVAIQKEVATELGCPMVDMYALTSDQGKNFPDNIHPNEAGYADMGRTVANYIKNGKTVPGTPVDIIAKATNKRVMVMWKTGGKGGTNHVSYNVYIDGELQQNLDFTSCTVKELVNGKTYTVQVSAVNEMGESPLSEAIEFTPTATTPKVSGVENGVVYDLADGYPKATWSTEATATLNGEEYLKDTEITSVGEYKLVVTNDNVVVEVSFSVVDSRTIPGDVDRDNNITVADALAILRVAAKLAVPEDSLFVVMDMDKDNEITVADALAVLRIAAKLN